MSDPTCGSTDDRAALFDYVFQATMRREAFSAIKYQKLGIDPEREMLKLEDEVIAADTPDKLYYALAKLSNTRKDRHLRISLIDGGIRPSHTAGIDTGVWPMRRDDILQVPVRFGVDYGKEGDYFVFVADVARDVRTTEDKVVRYDGRHADDVRQARSALRRAPRHPEPIKGQGAKMDSGFRRNDTKSNPNVGDKVLGVDGWPFDAWFKRVEPYQRYSTCQGLWQTVASWLGQKSFHLPPELYGETLRLELERPSGERYEVSLPYCERANVKWNEPAERAYQGFSRFLARDTFDAYRHTSLPVVLLDWHLFGAKLVEDIDELMSYAQAHNLLSHHLIFDGTRAGGGARGVYATQRLFGKTFRATFGNLRLSDVTRAFVAQREEMFARGNVVDVDIPETTDGGHWQIDWLRHDVLAALERGDEYAGPVPFKLAHAPKTSDNVFQPAPLHFSGKAVVLLGNYGGSHLDQFASIVVDNDLAHTIGMPTGGFSSTWEWEEDLVFASSKRLVVRYRWSMGRSIRPNGEVVEGNPAMPKEYFPQTRNNNATYRATLVTKALDWLTSSA